jgi:hypothetical protein
MMAGQLIELSMLTHASLCQNAGSLIQMKFILALPEYIFES